MALTLDQWAERRAAYLSEGFTVEEIVTAATGPGNVNLPANTNYIQTYIPSVPEGWGGLDIGPYYNDPTDDKAALWYAPSLALLTFWNDWAVRSLERVNHVYQDFAVPIFNNRQYLQYIPRPGITLTILRVYDEGIIYPL